MEITSFQDIIPTRLKIIIISFLLIIYFFPFILQSTYSKTTLGLFLLNLFFGRTPIPYIILILNIIENNQGTRKILKNQETINENIKILLKNKSNYNTLINDIFSQLKKQKEKENDNKISR